MGPEGIGGSLLEGISGLTRWEVLKRSMECQCQTKRVLAEKAGFTADDSEGSVQFPSAIRISGSGTIGQHTKFRGHARGD